MKKFLGFSIGIALLALAALHVFADSSGYVINAPNLSNTIGVLPVPNGGTGAVALGTSKQPILGNGTNAMTAATAPTTADALADVIFGASATTQKPLVVQAKASQSANVLEVQKSDGTLYGAIDPVGNLLVPAGTTANVSVGFTGEVNTGFYKSGAGTIALVSAGGVVGSFAGAGIGSLGYGITNVCNPNAGGYAAASTGQLTFDNGAGTADTGIARSAAGIIKITNGAAGNGNIQLPGQSLTSGTMTYATNAQIKKTLHVFTWTNAQVVAIGAVTAGDIAVCTLPAKTVVTNAYIVINTADGSANALTVALGRTSAAYIDYVVASDAKAAANTVYGDASGERGTNLTGYDLPSYTGTTVVNAHFIKTATNLSTVTTSTGTVYLETMVVP